MASETVTDKFATVNGLRLHYVDWGNAEAPSVIMLHGLRGQARTWDLLARGLSDTYHVLAIDQRGRGDSEWSPPADYFTQAYVSDLEQLVSQAGIERFMLIGHSMGGANAIVYAATHPAQVYALVVEDMGPAGAVPAPGGARISGELDGTPVGFANWDEARAFCRAERPTISAEALEDRMKNTLRQVPDGRITWKYDLDGIKKARQDTSRRVDLWPHFRNLSCPTLVLRGQQSDILLRDTTEAMAAANPNVRCVEVPNATHFVHDDNPESFNREVAGFLTEISNSR